jgi:hypothetical protein
MEQNETPLEVLAPSAIMAMEKAQIDIQIATAHQYPRSLEQFKKRALSMACLDPESADSCIYLRPVGKEGGKMKYAEGPSIRLAEIVAVSFGNLRAASKIVEQTERYVKCVGMAHDLEGNTAMQADCVESTVTKDGHPYSERQRALVAKACAAKALRDAIFKVVPRALCKPIMEAAKKVAAGQDKPLDERRKKAQAWVGTLKIDEARVFVALGVSGWADVNNDHLLVLTGLKTAMADGDETIDTAFPPIQGPQNDKKPAPTAHQQATQPAQVLKSEKQVTPVEAPRMPQDASEAPKGVQIPPTGGNEAVPGSGEAHKAISGTPEPVQTSPPEDESVLGEQGLAPAQSPTPTREPFKARPNESNETTAVRQLLYQASKSEEQLLAVLRANKAAKEGQSLADLSTTKLVNVANAWERLNKQMEGAK